MPQPLLTDAVIEELDREWNTKKVGHDNEVARLLALRTSIVEIQLAFNSQARRGFFTDDQHHDIQRHLNRIATDIVTRLEGAKGK
jgi:hypothetical protein